MIDLPEEHKNVFFALRPDEAWRTQFQDWMLKQQNGEKNIRWGHPDDAHITLRYLKQYPVANTHSLKETCYYCNLDAPKLKLAKISRIDHFGSAMIFLLEREKAYLTLIDSINNALVISPEPKPFVPHITFARLNHRALKNLRLEQFTTEVFPDIVPLASFAVMTRRTALVKGAPRYQILYERQLP